jgi:hypothetical protein
MRCAVGALRQRARDGSDLRIDGDSIPTQHVDLAKNFATSVRRGWRRTQSSAFSAAC